MNAKPSTIALITVLFCGIASAQDAPGGPFAGQVPVNASLKKGLGSKDAKVGQEIAATTENPVTIGSTLLPKGSTLLGHVVEVIKHSKDDANGSITIVFDHAQPKKSDPIEISASIYKISQSEGEINSQRQSADIGMRGSASGSAATAALRENTDQQNRSVTGTESKSGEPVHVVSAVPGVALSAVSGNGKSAILTSQNHDVALDPGTELVVGVKLK